MLGFIREIAVEAGKIAVEGGSRLTASEIHVKGTPTDLVTEIDRKVEAYLTGRIRERFPDHGIFGEESGETAGAGEYRWVIDPIDGTVNFIHGFPYYSISIALQKQGKTVAGVVYSPRLNELYAAAAGHGAALNGQPLRVSGCAALADSLLATGFACVRAGIRPDNLELLPGIVRQIQGIRRNGSAALDLYDVAAGALILQEAGGRVTDLAGRNRWPEAGICATNGLIHAELLKELQRQ